MLIFFLYRDKVKGGASNMISEYVKLSVAAKKRIILVVREKSSLQYEWSNSLKNDCIILKSKTLVGLFFELISHKPLLNKSTHVFAVNAYHALISKYICPKSRLTLNHWLVRTDLIGRLAQLIAGYFATDFIFEYKLQNIDIYGSLFRSKTALVVDTPIHSIEFKKRVNYTNNCKGLMMSVISYRKAIHRFLIKNYTFLKEKNIIIEIAGSPTNIRQKIYFLFLKCLVFVLGLKNNILFLGWVNNVEEVLNKADFFIICSYSEGLSGSLRKAVISGLPVYASDAGGNKQLVKTGYNGYLDKNMNSFNNFYYSIKSYLPNLFEHSNLTLKSYSLVNFKNQVNSFLNDK